MLLVAVHLGGCDSASDGATSASGRDSGSDTDRATEAEVHDPSLEDSGLATSAPDGPTAADAATSMGPQLDDTSMDSGLAVATDGGPRDGSAPRLDASALTPPEDGGADRDAAGREAATVCIPTSCEQLAADCGEVGDGCGGVLECGVCNDDEFCGLLEANICASISAVCVPATRQQACAGFECGTVADGCGDSLNCGDFDGGCPDAQICGLREPGVCSSPEP